MSIYQKEILSPVGKLTLVANEKSLLAILWANDEFSAASPKEKHPIFLQTEKELKDYFAGKRKIFEVPFEVTGTEFQIKVWQALKTIPYGTTCSYAQIAETIGHPKAVRAVGTAIGKNPLSIVIPCHRVIASNGKLGGFAGGLPNKQKLLNIEIES